MTRIFLFTSHDQITTVDKATAFKGIYAIAFTQIPADYQYFFIQVHLDTTGYIPF
jgi:hypothetical protein